MIKRLIRINSHIIVSLSLELVSEREEHHVEKTSKEKKRGKEGKGK